MKCPVDYLGNELQVGDNVVFVQLGYRNFLVGTICKITKSTVLISHKATNTYRRETKQTFNQVIKITNGQAFLKCL